MDAPACHLHAENEPLRQAEGRAAMARHQTGRESRQPIQFEAARATKRPDGQRPQRPSLERKSTVRTSPTVPVIAVAGLSLLAVGAGAGAASAAQRPAITNSQPESVRALMAERGAPLVTDTKGTAATRRRDRRDGPPMSAAAVRANDIKQQWA